MDNELYNMTILLDFYGNLLTDKQKTVMSYHYENDMSLSEISEEMGITRQGVHDIIKRSEKQLSEYENKLMLVQKFNEQREEILQLKKFLIDNNINSAIKIIDDLLNS